MKLSGLTTRSQKMKTLLTTAVLSAMFASSVAATETTNIEQVTAALMKQQNQTVTQAVENQVSQDIQFVLRAMQMPKVKFNDTMIAKVKQQSKTQDSE